MQRQPGLALWRQIYEQIEAEIAAGTVAPGTRLPTEPDLALRFAVNRHTVRRAMSELQNDGLVRIERGNGTFVADDVIDYPISRRTRYSDIVLAAGHEPSAEVLRHAEQPASTATAEALEVAAGTPVLRIVSMGRVDGRPLSVVDRQMPLPRFAGFAERYRALTSISQTLAEYGVTDYVRASTHVSTTLPDDTTAAQLQQPRTQPVLVTASINVDLDGRPIEYTVARYAGGRVRLRIEPG